MKVYYVYKHLRKDNGQPFYIGYGGRSITVENRAFRQKYKRAHTIGKNDGRSWDWLEIYHSVGRTVEIVCDNLSLEEAIKLEMQQIAIYGRVDVGTGILCNLTDGGEGLQGFRWSEAQRLRMSEAMKNRPPISEKTKAKIKKSLTEVVSRKIQCLETGDIFLGRLAVRDAMFPDSKSAHKGVSISCETGISYKGFHFVFVEDGRDMSFLRHPKKRGEGKKNAILSEDVVSRIKTMYNLGSTVKNIGLTLSIPVGSVSLITREISWAWVEPKITREYKSNPKLKGEQILEIKRLLLEGRSQSEIARILNIHKCSVQRIQSGQLHSEIGPRVLPRARKLMYNKDEVISHFLNGVSTSQIAKQYKVHITSVQRIVKPFRVSG